jgi:very-short-patch-repair endonuclease
MSEFNVKLEQTRRKLLDLTKRNKLINFKRPAKSRNLRIIDESPSFIYDHLFFKEKAFKFKFIPEPELLQLENKKLEEKKVKLEHVKKSTPFEGEKKAAENQINKISKELGNNKADAMFTAEEQAKKLGFDISLDLPEVDLEGSSVDDRYTDDYLQTLHYPSDLEKILKKIDLNSKQIIQETGANMLYMILGVLEWKESNHSEVKIKSPLINIPVSLKRGSLNKKTNTYEYVLEYTGEAIDTNKSLAEKLKNDFQIELPELTEELSFNEYMSEVKKICSDKRDWKIRQEVALDFLQFTKILMYKDLDELNWLNKPLSEHDVFKGLFLDGETVEGSYAPAEYDVDQHEVAKKIPLVLDADSSQHSAIVDVLEGKNVVIEGPPGTGKSQTIANMIASLMAEGKSVLFVSEKLAALEVVHKRLSNVGLEDFCLELHSHKTQKTQILDSLNKRLKGKYKTCSNIDSVRKELEYKKTKLKEYLDVLHREHGAVNKKIFDILWLTEKYQKVKEHVNFTVPKPKGYTQLEINETIDSLKKFQSYVLNYNFNDFYWNGFSPKNLTFIEIEEFITHFVEIHEIYSELNNLMQKLLENVDDELLIDFDEIVETRLISLTISHFKDRTVIDDLLLLASKNSQLILDYILMISEYEKSLVLNSKNIKKYDSINNKQKEYLININENEQKVEILKKKNKVLDKNRVSISGYESLTDIQKEYISSLAENKEHLNITRKKISRLKENEDTIVGYLDFSEKIKEYFYNYSTNEIKIDLIKNRETILSSNKETIINYDDLTFEQKDFIVNIEEKRTNFEAVKEERNIKSFNQKNIVQYDEISDNIYTCLMKLKPEEISTVDKGYLRIKENHEVAQNHLSKFILSDDISIIDFGEFLQVLNSIESFLYYDISLNQITNIYDETESIANDIYKLEKELISFSNALGIQIEYGYFNIENISKTLNLFNEINIDNYVGCHSEYSSNSFNSRLTEAKKEYISIKGIQSKIKQIFKISSLLEKDEKYFDEIKKTLLDKKDSIFKIFSSNFKQAKINYQSFLLNPSAENINEWIDNLDLIIEYLIKKEKFNNNKIYLNDLGKHFKGMDTDWAQIDNLNQWASKVKKEVKAIELRNILLSGEEDYYNAGKMYYSNITSLFISVEEKLPLHQELFNTLFYKQFYKHKEDINFQNFREEIENLNLKIDEFNKKINVYDVNVDAKLSSIINASSSYKNKSEELASEEKRLKHLLQSINLNFEDTNTNTFMENFVFFLKNQKINISVIVEYLRKEKENQHEISKINDTEIIIISEILDFLEIQKLTENEVIENLIKEQVSINSCKNIARDEQKLIIDMLNIFSDQDLPVNSVVQKMIQEKEILSLYENISNDEKSIILDFLVFMENQNISEEDLINQIKDELFLIKTVNSYDNEEQKLLIEVLEILSAQELNFQKISELLIIEESFKTKIAEIKEKFIKEYSFDMDVFSHYDLKTLKEHIEYNKIIQSSDLNINLKKGLIENFNNVYNTMSQINLYYGKSIEKNSQLSGYGNLNHSVFYGSDNKYQQYINKLNNVKENEKDLSIYLDYKNITKNLKELGLEDLLKAVNEGKLPIDLITDAFYYNFYHSLLKTAFQKYPLMNRFSRLSHEEIINSFKKLDVKLLELNKDLVALKSTSRYMPTSKSGGRVKDFTNKKLIEWEIGKKTRHIPTRQLIKRAGEAMQALKPCFMMSPLSVAQYLPPDSIKFDVLLVDEASQLRPEEALGVIARAEQIVIVGDPKQLPPTSFFDAIKDDGDNEEDTIVDESESILDTCMNLYSPVRRLKWHYRSQHESLIDFSNKKFYEDDLIVFPSPSGVNSDELGVKHTYIPDAIYQSGSSQRFNKLEAKILVEHAENQMDKYPDKSLGIGTFNTSQRDLIQQMIDDKEKNNPAVAKYIQKWKNSPEPFFIKNLESLQGDERDVIFISTTYGKDKTTGQVMQRFGPINQDNGWRRLNVLFTRSKQKMHVFTSMQSGDIKIGDTSSEGVRSLRAFLKYLETGMLVDKPDITGKGFDSPFEESVYELLSDVGIKTIPQVGVAGYFIDLAVEAQEGHDFILAIECDGATYHSSKSARDRDRLKDEVLKNLGWRVYRIWSVDWFKNREHEVQKLIKVIKEEQATYSEKYRVRKEAASLQQKIIEEELSKEKMEKEKKINLQNNEPLQKSESTKAFLDDEATKQLLIEFRDNEIAKDFEINHRCVLSSVMIDQFVKHKPLDMDEFRNKIPLRLRTSLDREQLVYMNKVFEILELADE